MGIWRYPIDELLSSRAKISLLRSFMTLGRAVSGRHAARLAQIPEKTAREALNDLVELGVIVRREATGQHLLLPNREHVLWEPLRDLFDAERERIALARKTLADVAHSSGGTVVSLLIYGSAARGEDIPGSDLDLLVLVESEEDVSPVRDRLGDIVSAFGRQFGLNLSPVILTDEEFHSRRSQDDPFVAELLRDAEVVFGRNPTEVAHG